MTHHWIALLLFFDHITRQRLSSAWMLLELGLIATRAWIENQRLSRCIKAIDEAINHQDLQSNNLDELSRAKAHAEAMLLHTYKKLAVNFGVTLLSTCLFVFKNILLPYIVVSVSNPLIPFIFAAIAFSISIANHYLNQYVDQEKPKIPKQEQSTRHSFFHEKPTGITFNKNNGYLMKSITG